MATRFLGEHIASLTQQIEKLQAELTQQKENASTESVAIGRYRDLGLTLSFGKQDEVAVAANIGERFVASGRMPAVLAAL